MKVRCVLGCPPGQANLFHFPANAELRTRWLEFLHFDERGLNTASRVCAKHFIQTCFSNYMEHSMGFATALHLTDTAVPSVYTVGGSPTLKPLTRDVCCQYTPCMEAVYTQVPREWSKPPTRRSKAIQVRPLGRSVSVGCSMDDDASTPRKRPRVDYSALESSQDESFCPREPRGSTYVPDVTQDHQRWAASPQTPDPANQTSRSRPQLINKDIPDLAPHDVCVNIACLLRLFRRCGQCSGQCVVRKQGDKRHFTVVQHCQMCNQLTTWTSQPFKEEEQSVDLCEVTEGKQELTASLIIRKWFDSNTDSASSGEESLSTDEDVKMVIPAELAEAESVAPPGEGSEGDQEMMVMMRTKGSQTDGGRNGETSQLPKEEKRDNAPEDEERSDLLAEVEMMVMMRTKGSQTDGGRNGETSQLPKEEKRDNAPEDEDRSDLLAEVELTVDSDSQRSQEDNDGGEEEEEEGEGEEKGEGGMEDKHIIKEEEAEDTEESETQEEEDEWEMDDEDDDDDDEEEWEQGMDEGSKVRKRLRGASDSPLCRRTYSRMSIMKREQKRSETLCPDCGRLYRTLSHKCDPKKKFQCPDCGVFFLTDLSLSVHRNGHCRSRSQPCVFCLKPFKTRTDRLTHEMSHTGDEPYECPKCPRRFWDRSTRSRHLKEHPKSFRCQTCQKDFSDLFVLHRHEMSHSANKPFKCEVCDRMFAQASQLKSHLRVHTGEKPFQCRLCPKSFNHNVSLKNHTSRYHKGASHDPPGGLGPAADDGAKQETEMKDGSSQKLTFWTELDITPRGDGGGGVEGDQWLPACPEEQQHGSQGILNNHDSDFDPQEERIASKRRGRGRGRGRGGRHE